MPIVGTHHTGYTVANLERSLAFYVDLLGFEVLWSREITEAYFRTAVAVSGCVVKAAHLTAPGANHVLELFEYVTSTGTPADVSSPNPGRAHTCYLVDDLDAIYADLKTRGVHFRSPPVLIDKGVNSGAKALCTTPTASRWSCCSRRQPVR